MRASVLAVLFAAAGLLLIAAPASARMDSDPDPVFSTTDGDFMLGNARGQAVARGLPNVRLRVTDGYEVVVRDYTNTPVPGATVTMEFAGSGLQVHAAQTSGQVADCVANRITLVTDANGRAIFFPACVGENSSATPNVQLRDRGVLLLTIWFRTMDLVPVGGGGAGEVNVADLNEFRFRFLGQNGHTNLDPECDFATEGSSSGRVDSSDLNIFRLEFLCGTGGGAPAPCSMPECGSP